MAFPNEPEDPREWSAVVAGGHAPLPPRPLLALSRRFAVYPVRVSRITSGQRLWSQAGALALSLGSVLHGRVLVFLRVGCPLYHHTLSGDSDPGVTGAVRTHT